ncbi:protein FRG1 homolog [Daktulosphaira vitifoliae]|uniref:protein FRG1 homolog n=1 Tax=Daktulosphaira vitifoliae TaxID=58002 RepID=UPI0021AA3B52|nr:protein FRG1 homolog [Daktulosphaira vitifoliae]
MSEYHKVRVSKLILKNEKVKKKKKKDKSKNNDPKINKEESIDKISHGNWAEAKIISEISGPIALEFGNQTYVTAMDNGLFTLGPPHNEGDGPLPEEILTAIAINETRVAFKSGYGKYLGVDKDGTIVGRSDAIGLLEQFEPIFQDNKLAILASTGCFISIRNEDDSLVAMSRTAGSNEIVKVRLHAPENTEEESNVLDEKKGNIKDIEKNYVKMFQKFQDKKMRVIEGKHSLLKKAQKEGKLHESLLDRRAKTKADRYCK